MFYILLMIQAALCLMMIGLVLLQQGKGADMGAAFGGGASSVFGASGAGNFISRLTTGVCVAFMVTSVLLVRAYGEGGHLLAGKEVNPLAGSLMEGVAAPAESTSEKKDAPVDAQPAAPAAAPAPAQEAK